MPRKLRIEKNGFYHIVNRGVARDSIYHDNEDFEKFLDITQEASDEYHFEIYSYCLMSNHYHLLMEISNENLSIIMQKINSRYSMFYNNKYRRVGPLWQGRFKSWFVYDETYLEALVKYIEFNPIKANITTAIGQYKWAMSSHNSKCSMLNFELINAIDFSSTLDEKEQEDVEKVYSAKLHIEDKSIKKQTLKSFETYLIDDIREVAIAKSISDGYTQKEIARFLKLSDVAISKIYKKYRQKVKLFNKLRDKGFFWSYSEDISFDVAGESLTIEYLLKYGDFDDIRLGFEFFGKRVVRKVWDEKLKSDKQFIKTNLLIARVFFGMDVESDYFKELKNERLEKFKLLAS